ncbi:hypothetical protein [Bradyrhizobium cytisi]|uniref:Uncharacterized protein n=1 Tax=Bradyrhizobium cytisi TaxID=515489 RepID=A0A5S4WBI2_9BRAD|nr:hypothetical protein [Bradyrhizobium cytisi]TYL71806.1 hypothetical protein FXB38_39635 [Bradyrhizobium cytisi]
MEQLKALLMRTKRPYRPSLIGMPLAAVLRRAIAGHAKPINPREISLLKSLFKQGVSYPKTGEELQLKSRTAESLFSPRAL